MFSLVLERAVVELHAICFILQEVLTVPRGHCKIPLTYMYRYKELRAAKVRHCSVADRVVDRPFENDLVEVQDSESYCSTDYCSVSRTPYYERSPYASNCEDSYSEWSDDDYVWSLPNESSESDTIV